MKALLDNLKALGPRRLAILGGVGLLVLAAIGWLAWEASRPKMAILYSGIAPAEAGQIVSQLEAMGITVGTSFDGSTIQVPAPDVARARVGLGEEDRELGDEVRRALEQDLDLRVHLRRVSAASRSGSDKVARRV